MTDHAGPAGFGLEPRRQWWGVYSVRAHMNPRALAREILLYDRLVLPTPKDKTEADRWDHQGWDTYQLAYPAEARLMNSVMIRLGFSATSRGGAG